MKRAISYVFLSLFLISTSLGGYGYYKYREMTSQWFQPLSSVAEETDIAPEQKSSAQLKPFTMLLLGIDARDEQKSRSDTMMFAAVNPKKKQVTLLSMPRDTLVEIPGYGQDKLNHAMFYGGPSLVKRTMEQTFALNVDRYMSIDFEGFAKIVDELNGVEINVKRRMKYEESDDTRIDLYPGVQHLDGIQTLNYARFRKSDIDSDASDFDRMNRQQEVLKELTTKAMRLGNFSRLFTWMNILEDHVKTDLSVYELRRLAVSFKGFTVSEMKMIELNGVSQRIPKHGYHLWFHVPAKGEQERIKAIIEHTLDEKKSHEETTL